MLHLFICGNIEYKLQPYSESFHRYCQEKTVRFLSIALKSTEVRARLLKCSGLEAAILPLQWHHHEYRYDWVSEENENKM